METNGTRLLPIAWLSAYSSRKKASAIESAVTGALAWPSCQTALTSPPAQKARF